MDDEMNAADGPDEDWDEEPGLGERLRRGPWRLVLLWLALLSGVAWIVSNGLLQIRFLIFTPTGFASEAESEFYEWVQVVNGICYTLFVFSVGIYVVLWLATRDREDT
jgi:hypothetical protein